MVDNPHTHTNAFYPSPTSSSKFTLHNKHHDPSNLPMLHSHVVNIFQKSTLNTPPRHLQPRIKSNQVTTINTTTTDDDNNPDYNHILIGYAFGPKKLQTMGSTMALSGLNLRVFLPAQAAPSSSRSPSHSLYCDSVFDSDSSSGEYSDAGSLDCDESQADILDPMFWQVYNHNHNPGSGSVVSGGSSNCSLGDGDGDPSEEEIYDFEEAFEEKEASWEDGGRSEKKSKIYKLHFIPLLLSLPLDDQIPHNLRLQTRGFNCILHKLTEDILLLTQQELSPSPSPQLPHLSSEERELEQEQEQELTPTEQAQNSISLLEQYTLSHPSCNLIDPPSNVKLVMNRLKIAQILQGCLSSLGCTIRDRTSNEERFMNVRSPAHVILRNEQELHELQTTGKVGDMTLPPYPLISKPLTACGSTSSHKMVIVLNSRGLKSIPLEEGGVLLQSYVNHDAMLYKVYVLGGEVRVFERTSCPNLPESLILDDFDERETTMEVGGEDLNAVAFDSQRGYPRLADFGVDAITNTDKNASESEVKRSAAVDKTHENNTSDEENQSKTLTSLDITPVANLLRRTFGLDLFGFDCVITSPSETGKREVIVVDVNYFPSYKEMGRMLPKVLGEYLVFRSLGGKTC